MVPKQGHTFTIAPVPRVPKTACAKPCTKNKAQPYLWIVLHSQDFIRMPGVKLIQHLHGAQVIVSPDVHHALHAHKSMSSKVASQPTLCHSCGQGEQVCHSFQLWPLGALKGWTSLPWFPAVASGSIERVDKSATVSSCGLWKH
eukprot:1143696-Pelagomonas_calceolata.AAC.3